MSRPWIDEETGQLVVYEDADPAQPPHDHVIRTEDGKHVVPVPTPLHVLGETIRVTDEMRQAEERLHAAETQDEKLGAVRDLELLELLAVEERLRSSAQTYVMRPGEAELLAEMTSTPERRIQLAELVLMHGSLDRFVAFELGDI
ncbi:hypothetical protein [Paenirhodobacter populi]|uniref:Uncharacterized protein n=1 Tax=Paenirhodobacter populi TaxID=2306993 RepID=A0A443J061_9RHOB|nr:hypothetical protein [Sinirhodobacter populi]RWR13800.1 hypothetical protein D2T33_05220 [Sinirhodobacter populi]